MGKYNFKCPVCRDKGREDGCPECGKHLDPLLSTTRKDVGISELSTVMIPKHYLNNPWDSLVLAEDKSEYIDDADFKFYMSQLDMVYNHVKSGGIIKNSALISAPLGYGKTTWAYNCMMELLKHDYKVVPLIDTVQLKSMHTKTYERPTWVNRWANHNYEDFINADVLFLAVSKGPEYIYASKLIIDILDIRSRLSNPTIVLSDWPIKKLIESDDSGMLKSLLRGGSRVDPNKYLVPITFSEYIKS